MEQGTVTVLRMFFWRCAKPQLLPAHKEKTMFQYRNVMADRALALALPQELERKEANSETLMTEIKKAIDDLGSAHDEFKKVNDQRIKTLEKKGATDVVLEEKLTKIGIDLDKLSEAKTALEKRLDTEKKEREELELRLQRAGTGKSSEGAADELKSFNLALASHASERKQVHEDMSAEGYAAYKAAFANLLRKDNRMLTTEEIKTLSVGSDPDGGYLVTPDVSGRIVKKVYETSEMRSIASQQTISTDFLEGIEDLDEAGAGYAGETSQGPDSKTPQIGKWRIPVFILDTEPKATQSILDDAGIDVEAWLADKVANKFGRFENVEFCTGASRIRGITSYPVLDDTAGSGVAWGSMGYVFTGTAGDFGSSAATTSDKLFDLVGILKNAYLPNANWVMRRSVITKIRKFKDTTGQYLWQPALAAGTPERLLDYPITRMEDMPALAANSLSIAFGDFKAGYQIVDRQGIRVLRDPFTSKPYVKFYTTKRTGGGVLNYEAIKFMKFGVS
jgi:HK97 family phage major capsid protein